jgi:SAM-dependent methyltransferase
MSADRLTGSTLMPSVKKSRFVRMAWNWLNQFWDPIRTGRALCSLPRFLADWHKYAHMNGAEPLRLLDSWPQLHDRRPNTPFDAHYFWTGGWAMRRILAQKPASHVDVGSQTLFVNLLSAVVPVTFVDYRPLDVHVEGLSCRSGDILNLPFQDRSVDSLSCLHVAEHIGLGRYGDPLTPDGTRRACAELQRVLAPGGNLYFAVPVGKERVCFNGCRIHTTETIIAYFNELDVLEFSVVDDGGQYIEHADRKMVSNSHYACGLFRFHREAEEQQQ